MILRFKELLDWQVRNSMPFKKVVVFIVEGITDKISIGNIVTKLNKDNKIYFQIVNRDITSDYSSNSTNIITKINEQIRVCIREQHFKSNDIIKVIHLVDTDGAFVGDECIVYKDTENVEYDTEHIYTNNVEKLKQRNLNKTKILEKLSCTNQINKIPYEIYFFSTNLEHVLHNIQNAKKDEKQDLAENFQDKYYDNPEKFISFINDEVFALKDTYKNTWNFIKRENNSLKRYTNFNLYFANN